MMSIKTGWQVIWSPLRVVNDEFLLKFIKMMHF
jgi:hypothetical protein